MNSLHRLLLATAFPILSCAAFAAEPAFKEDFSKTEVGAAPEGLMIMSGQFAVKEDGGNKVLELPGSPLDTFGALFGPAPATLDGTASARFLGTKQGRKFPTFAVSLHGVGGFRLQASPGKKALEIYKGDVPLTSVPLKWESGKWTHLRIQVRAKGEGAVIEGKVWADGSAEPAEWMIKHEEASAPKPGRAGIWGSPYAGTEIRFDDLAVSPVK